MSDPRPLVLDGRTVVVAGATGGIGEGACRSLLRHGADVVAVGRDARRLQELARRLPTTGPGSLSLVTADLTAAGGPSDDSWFVGHRDAVDGVLVVIGDAGRAPSGTLLDIPDEEARAMIEANEIGGLRALRALVPLVRPSGAVVNGLGFSAEIPFPRHPLMGSTNAAMRSMLTSLASQLEGTGPRVYGLVLGMVRTRARQEAGVDDARWLTGDDVGDYVAELVVGSVPDPRRPLRYLLDPAVGPTLTPPVRA